jgi:hypothetical protein
MISSVSPLKLGELIVVIKIVPTVESQGRSNHATIGVDALCLQAASSLNMKSTVTVTEDCKERVFPKSKPTGRIFRPAHSVGLL